jgi:hypothetical protein
MLKQTLSREVGMNEQLHPAATRHLPSFITAPGETDVLMIVMATILGLSVLMFGILFLRLHTLPERIAHKSHKLQFEIVAVLGLIALFTHMHIFWVIGLLLALIDLPDFGGSLNRIAGSAEKIAGLKPGEGLPSEADEDDISQKGDAASELKPAVKQNEGAVFLTRPEIAAGKQKERIHA